MLEIIETELHCMRITHTGIHILLVHSQIHFPLCTFVSYFHFPLGLYGRGNYSSVVSSLCSLAENRASNQLHNRYCTLYVLGQRIFIQSPAHKILEMATTHRFPDELLDDRGLCFYRFLILSFFTSFLSVTHCS